jgi:hypothetical protein
MSKCRRHANTSLQRASKTLLRISEPDSERSAVRSCIHLLYQLKFEVPDLEAKRQALRRQKLDAVAAVESYGKLPFIDEAERLGTRQELTNLLQTVIDDVEWRQDPKDPKRGEALIKLYELWARRTRPDRACAAALRAGQRAEGLGR